MNKYLASMLVFVASAATTAAQDGPYLYATYYECEPASVASADEAREGVVAGLNAHADAGAILGWGWSAHHTGGTWDRLAYFLAPTIEGLLDFQNAWSTELAEDHTAARDALRRACPEHVDYIWRQIATSQTPDTRTRRAPASYSTYFACDRARLDRVDEIARGSLATALNAMVADGSLFAWHWHGHVLGGNFARLLVLDGATHAAVISANTRIGEHMNEADGAEFTDICGNHQDYLWSVIASR